MYIEADDVLPLNNGDAVQFVVIINPQILKSDSNSPSLTWLLFSGFIKLPTMLFEKHCDFDCASPCPEQSPVYGVFGLRLCVTQLQLMIVSLPVWNNSSNQKQSTRLSFRHSINVVLILWTGILCLSHNA